MIRDLVQDTPNADVISDVCDVCIVGAGAAGIVLAVELARQGRQVVLLEGGGPDVEEASQEPYRSELAGLHHNGVHEGRFRSLGGSTTRWGGQILELDPADFAPRAWIAGSGWPFGLDVLSPYYARAIELEGLAQATLEDAAVWREIGLTAPAFDHFETFFSRWCPEINFARLHQQALTSSPGITVWLHANAVAPVVEGGRVTGVVARTLTGVSHTFHARQFVWCMGGIESSRFFLQPELEAMPWNRSGLLGRHFQDHLIAPTARIEPIGRMGKRRFLADFANVFSRGYKYQPKLRLELAQQQEHAILNVAAMIFFHTATVEIESELKATAKKLLRGKLAEVSRAEFARLLGNAGLLARQSWAYTISHRAYIPPDARIELGVHCEQPPDSASSVQLTEERDALGMLRTRLDWRVSDLELRSVRVCTEMAARSLAGIARVIPVEDLYRETFRDKCGDGYHHMGGMRMSVAAADGVVDPDLKLHGIENGYVCSSAVFPCSGFSNPTHTVIALAVRLADHLARDLAQ